MWSGKISDLVFQHKYNKLWYAYSDRENRLLNNAVEKNQKTVTLPNSKIVNLDKMFQKNLHTLIEQDIRCLVYSDAFYSWQWKDDSNDFISYKPRIVFLLEVALKRGKKSFKFYDDGKDYVIDLEVFCQENEKTKYKRTVLRKKESVNITKFVLNISNGGNIEFKKMVENQEISFENRFINLPSAFATSLNLNETTENISLSTVVDVSNERSEGLDFVFVDEQCPNRNNFTVYCESDLVWSVALSCVSCASNTNKFYIIQLLKKDLKKNQYVLFQRYGRVGTKGQTEFNVIGSDIVDAKAAFEAKFYEKTGNGWLNKDKFRYIPGKYNLLKIVSNPEEKRVNFEACLEPPTKSLLEMICDQNIMAEIMKEMCYDSLFPLGKLTIKQLKDGYIALNRIATAISEDMSGSSIVNASSEFYTIIPHNFGRKSPPVISTKEDIVDKLRMLEALSNLRIAFDIINTNSTRIEHPLNKYYNSFSVQLEPLNESSEVYATLKMCLEGTHGPTHTTHQLEIVDAFCCLQKNESSFINLEEKLLLWHGSRITNWVGIFKEGLRIAPAEAPATGCMFGKGIYFADTSSKSANYCLATKKSNEGLLLFCEVSVGNQMRLNEGDDSLPSSLPPSVDSVVGLGRLSPVFQTSVLSSEAKAPFGPVQTVHGAETNPLQYNEYVIYDVRQVKIKYILRIRFVFK